MNLERYRKEYKEAFIALNRAWVEKYFTMEEEDYKQLYDTDRYLEMGGMIFFAVEQQEVLATCMVYPQGGEVWEICKLAADELKQGRGAGSLVFKACMDYAIERGAKKLTLISNHRLTPALHLYDKFGFVRVPVDRAGEYERCDVQCEYLVPEKLRQEKRPE